MANNDFFLAAWLMELFEELHRIFDQPERAPMMPFISQF